MPRFIAVPKSRPAAAALMETAGGYSAPARVERIEAIRRVCAADERVHLPEKLLRKVAKAGKHKVLATPTRHTPLTGITVIDCDVRDAEDLQNELPHHEVTEDFDLDLVAPSPTAAAPPQDDIDRWHLGAIKLREARTSGFSGAGAGIGVAVLDTGVAEVDEIAGRIKAAHELNDEMEPVAIDTRDTDGHGTGVAALIAGKTIGVAPSVDLYNFITIPRRRGSYSNFLLATEFIAGQPGISIANISAGISGWEPRIKPGIRALLDTCILPVVAVGNEGADTARSPGNYTEVLSVGAANKRGRVWSGSGSATMVHDSMSYTVPDIVAPGERVTTCNGAGQFRVFNGSSLATPIVSGIAALIIEKHPDIRDHELREAILEASLKLENVAPLRQGSGMLQLPSALWSTGP